MLNIKIIKRKGRVKYKNDNAHYETVCKNTIGCTGTIISCDKKYKPSYLVELNELRTKEGNILIPNSGEFGYRKFYYDQEVLETI